MSWSVTNFLVAPFQLLELKGSLIAWGSMWYYQQIIMVSLIIGFTYLKWGKILQRFQVKMNCDVVEDERVKLKSQTIGGVNDNVKKQ